MGALAPSTFEGQDLVRGGGLSRGLAQLRVMVFCTKTAPFRKPAGTGEVACVLTVETHWRVQYEFGGGREAATEGDVLVNTFICDCRICEMQDYQCWHTGTVGCLAMTRSQELSMLQCIRPHDNVSIVLTMRAVRSSPSSPASKANSEGTCV